MLWNYIQLRFFIFQLVVLLFFVLLNKKKGRGRSSAEGQQYIYKLKDIALILLYAMVIYSIIKIPLLANKFFSVDIIANKFKFLYILLLENGYSVALFISVLIYKVPNRIEEIKKMCAIDILQLRYLKFAALSTLIIVSLNLLTYMLFKYKILNQIYGLLWQNHLLSFPFYIFVWVMSLCILAPFIEEIFFRGILYNTLNQYGNSWLSFLISVLLWVVIHPIKEFIPMIILGVILQSFYKKSKSILPSFIIHSAVNFLWIVSNLIIAK